MPPTETIASRVRRIVRSTAASRANRERERAKAEAALRTAQRESCRDPHVLLFREERKEHTRRHALALAEAKAAFTAMLEKEAEARKGGRRPKIKVGRAQFKRDPANALLEALESVHG